MLGFQLGDNSAGPTIAAGSVYLDAITATGGTQNCAVAIGTGAHTFEAALDANVYKKDGSETDTVATQSTDHKTGSRLVEGRVHGAPGPGGISDDLAQGLHQRPGHLLRPNRNGARLSADG